MLAGTIVVRRGIWRGRFPARCARCCRLPRPIERAGLLSAFYVEGYLSFSLPAVLTGFSGADRGADISRRYAYGVAVIVMALLSMLAIGFSRGKR